MRRLVFVLALAACQQGAAPTQTPDELVQRGLALARVNHRTTRAAPPPAVAPVARCSRFCPPEGYPIPPSDEPKPYAAWLAAQSQPDQKRIAAFCKQHPDDYELVCGGIGPTRIPYRPGPRIFASEPGDPVSRFKTDAEWEAALTPWQRRYWKKTCWHGESSPSNDLCGDNTPLVVAFDDQRVELTAGGSFAFQPGVPTATDWPTAATPWIALDRDGDGRITSGAELFGSDTVLPTGVRATNGFEALATLDANHDGRIDADDPAFASLLLWADRNNDQRTTPDELSPLGDQVVSISLADRREVHCDARDNCEGERAALVSRGSHAGSVVDIYLPRR